MHVFYLCTYVFSFINLYYSFLSLLISQNTSDAIESKIKYKMTAIESLMIVSTAVYGRSNQLAVVAQ